MTPSPPKADRPFRRSKSASELHLDNLRSTKPTKPCITIPAIPFQIRTKPSSPQQATFKLRPWTLRDTAARLHHRNDPSIQQYLDAPTPYTIGDALREITRNLDAARRTCNTPHAITWPADLFEWEGDEDDEEGNAPLWFPFAIATDADEAIGEIRMLREDRHRVEIVYWLSAEWRGRGVMVAAVRGLARWVFGSMGMVGVERFEAWIARENRGSVGVARGAGMRCEGVLRRALWLRRGEGGVGDQEVWAVTRGYFAEGGEVSGGG